MESTLFVVLGLLLRIGLPLGLTILVFALLRRLDQRWQAEARASVPVVPASQKPCWEVRGCPECQRKDCPAAKNARTPCWQTFRSREGTLKEACLDCDVFRQAPPPVRA
ncbi:MAG: hypothetical protein JXB85_02385 [Anaerolineales bacterium]|nr:hypothetical protein [Anaerolineales bacterium]